LQSPPTVAISVMLHATMIAFRVGVQFLEMRWTSHFGLLQLLQMVSRVFVHGADE
jgi:hypothetical protein